jgi:hypothetical protein
LSDEFKTPHTVARLVLDTQAVIEWWDEKWKYQELELLYEQCRVSLAKTDVVDTELDPERSEMVEGCFLKSIRFLELHGPFVHYHSRLDHAVVASPEDEKRLNRVKDIVGVRITTEVETKHFRDAMHIATSIRYGYDGLITEDKRLLKRNDRFLSEFGFRVMNVEGAVAHVNKLIDHQAYREELNWKLWNKV